MALHGVTPAAVAGAARLADLWPHLGPMLARADRVIAHNAAFDRGVLERTLERSEGGAAGGGRLSCGGVASRRS